MTAERQDARPRYARHDLIDWFSRAEVSAARIAVVGAGAIGNEVIKNLALLGAGAVDVFDFDIVEAHNLTRSVFLRESDVGQPKATAVVGRAAEVDPNCQLRAIDGDIRDVLTPSRLSGYSAVVAAVDNFEARLRLNQLCLYAAVDLVNAAIDSRFVSIEVFGHSQPGSACYECHLPESAYQRLAERYSCGGLRRIAHEEKKIPTTAITASLAGAMAAAAALRLGSLENSSRRVFMDSQLLSSRSSPLSPQSDCPLCASLRGPLRRLQAAPWPAELGTPSFEDEAVLVLPDPVVTTCRCRQCGRDEAALGTALQAIGQRASRYDESLSWCPFCRAWSVDVEQRDRFSPQQWREFEKSLANHGSGPPPYALVHRGSETVVLEWLSATH